MPSSFLAYISAEQVMVNAALEKEINSLHPLVQPVLRHVLLSGGKRVRPALAALAARLMAPEAGSSGECLARERVPGECSPGEYLPEDGLSAPLEINHSSLGVALELLHGASLLHDDIVDAADLRRGRPTAHKIYGLGTVVLAGDILLAKSVQMVAELGQAELTEIFAQAITETAAGEIAELAILRDIDLSTEDYLEIIKGKTAWLLRASCELGARLAGAGVAESEAMASYGHNLGMAFQMVDDALDFSPCSKDTGKPVGGDLREGKLTPPLRLYYNSLSGGEREAFAAKFKSGSFNAAEVLAIGEQIREQGFADRTRTLAEEYLEKARVALSALPSSRHSRREYALLLGLLDYVGYRRT